MLAPTAATVFSDDNIPGSPSSGPKKVKKSEVRAWGAWLESFVTAIGGSGGSVYLTRAQLFADLQHDANDMAWVVQDEALSGIYRKNGAAGTGSWTRVADLPYSVIIAEDEGTGTPNAIHASSAQPISSTAQVWLTVSTTNTGSPVTVSFNDGSPLTIKTNSGGNVAPGAIVAGSILIGKQDGSTFRLASDQASAAIQAAMEAVFGQFQSQYLGEYATAPTSDPNGDPIRQGAFYWNTASIAHFYWDGAAWQGFPFATVADDTVTDVKLSAALRNRISIDGGTLSAIHSSRAVAEPVFMANGLADGFGGEGGINTSASSGYVLDPGNGRVMNGGNPVQQVDSFSYVPLATSAGGWAGNTLRQKFAGVRISQGGNKVRILCKGGSSGATFSSVYVGHAGAGGSFTGDQVPLTFGGGVSTLTLAANEEEWSDWVSYAVTAGSPLIIAAQCTAGGTIGRINPTDADFTLYYKAGTDAATTTATGYTTSVNDIVLVEQIQVEQPDSTENIALVTAAFEFIDFTPTQVKVSGIFEALDALTLNTDVKIDVSRDGGTTWTAATMTQLKALGSRTYFETNIVSVSGQPSGDEISIRYRTFNLKRCYLCGIRTEVNA